MHKWSHASKLWDEITYHIPKFQQFHWFMKRKCWQYERLIVICSKLHEYFKSRINLVALELIPKRYIFQNIWNTTVYWEKMLIIVSNISCIIPSHLFNILRQWWSYVQNINLVLKKWNWCLGKDVKRKVWYFHDHGNCNDYQQPSSWINHRPYQSQCV